jgi:hypothetical protein
MVLEEAWLRWISTPKRISLTWINTSRSSNPRWELEVPPRGSCRCARLALLDLLEVSVEEVRLVRVSQDPWILELIHVDVVLADAVGVEQAPVDLVVDLV